jgi:RNA polymerase sigma-70 factor (ECF subfamily)
LRIFDLWFSVASGKDPYEMIFGKSVVFDREGLPQVASATYDSHVFAEAERDFIERLRIGDPEAFDNLVTRYSGDIYAVLFRITENAEEAADLTQETFLSALKAIKTFRGDSELKTWLFRIAVNHSRNRFRWWKRRKRDVTISLDAPIGDSDSTVSETIAGDDTSAEDTVLRLEREAAIRKALGELPEIYREAIILCDIEGLTYEEIAAALEINIGTVKSRIARGRDELRRRLKGF